MRLGILTVACIFVLLGPGLRAEAVILPALPAPYQDYQIVRSHHSGDTQYEIISPKSPDDTVETKPTLLVVLSPFRVLYSFPQDAIFRTPESYGNVELTWASDSTAFEFVITGKWGPREIYVISMLKAGGKSKVVVSDLGQQIRKQVQPEFLKAKVTTYNEHSDYIFNCDDGGEGWPISEKNQISLSFQCTTDPKRENGKKGWTLQLDAVWDIAQAKFVSWNTVLLPTR